MCSLCSTENKVFPDIKSKAFSSQICGQTIFFFLQVWPNNSTARRSLELLHARIFCCLHNYKLFGFLRLWLSPSLSISHCLTLLSDYCEVLKRNQRGICAPLCRSVPVLSVDTSSHLILHSCPSRHMQTSTHMHRELNFGYFTGPRTRCIQ